MFSAKRLTLARKIRGLRKGELAKLASISTRSLSDIEKGEGNPSQSMICAISTALDFPIGFFECDESVDFNIESISFRSKRSMSVVVRDMGAAIGELCVEISNWLESEFNLKSSDVPDLSGMDPELAAEIIRTEWHLDLNKCFNMVHLLESRGVRVFSLYPSDLKLDALSFFHDGIPFVLLNQLKSVERSRFDAAHELGHLVLHRNRESVSAEAEKEADAFASAFLMPKCSVLTLPRSTYSINHLIKLKKIWGVSLAALNYRLHHVGILTEWNCRNNWLQMAQRGFRVSEPEPLPDTARERSQIADKVVALLHQEKRTLSDIAKVLQVRKRDLALLMFNAEPSVVTTNAATAPKTSKPCGALRLIQI